MSFVIMYVSVCACACACVPVRACARVDRSGLLCCMWHCYSVPSTVCVPEEQLSDSASQMLRSTDLQSTPYVKHGQQAVVKVPMRQC